MASGSPASGARRSGPEDRPAGPEQPAAASAVPGGGAIDPGPEPEEEELQPALLQLPWAFARAGGLLCLAAVALPLLALLPPALADPAWWRRASAVLPAHAPVALLGLSLVHLAALLDPDNRLLQRRLRRLRRGAATASLVLLLLVPLQLLLLLRADAVSPAARSRADQQVERRFAALRSAVVSSRSVPELRERLQLLQGPPLAPQADALPLAVVQRRLLLALERSRPFVQERLSQGLGERALAREGFEALSAALPALLYAFALGAFSPLGFFGRPEGPRTTNRPARRGLRHQRLLEQEVEGYLAGEEPEGLNASAESPDRR